MKIEEKGHTRIIRDPQNDSSALLMKLTHEYKSFEDRNLILDLSGDQNLTARGLSQFSALARQHKKNGKSLVIVNPSIDFNAVPAAVHAVPTLGEAHDLIEMDEIERDLGF